MEEDNLSSPPKPPSPPLRTPNAPSPAQRFFVAPKKSKIQPPSIELPASTEEPILIPNPTEDSNLSNITLADKSHKKNNDNIIFNKMDSKLLSGTLLNYRYLDCIKNA